MSVSTGAQGPTPRRIRSSSLAEGNEGGQSNDHEASSLGEAELPLTGQRTHPAAQEPTRTTNAPLLLPSPDPSQTVPRPHADRASSPVPALLPTPSQDRRSSLSSRLMTQGSDYVQSQITSRGEHIDRGSQETITRPQVSATTQETQPQVLNTSPPSPSVHSITPAPGRRTVLEDVECAGNHHAQPHVRILQDAASVHSSVQRGHPRTRSNSPPLRQEVSAASTSDTEADTKKGQPRSTNSGGILRGYQNPLPPLPGTSSAGPPSPHLSSQVDHSITHGSMEGQHPSPQQHTRWSQSSINAGLNIDRSSGAGSRSNVFVSSLGTIASAPTPGSHGPGIMESTRDEQRLSTAAAGPSVVPSHPSINRSRTLNSINPRSDVDWIIPLDDKHTREKSVGERLNPTLEKARSERDKYAFKAKMTGYTLNIAIGLQIVIGSLTTGLAVVTEGKQTSIMTAILGGFATIIASFLARARGTHEPELSITRVKDLEQYIRECEKFLMDYGHLLASTNPEHQSRLEELRNRLEELLGNGNGERKLVEPA